MLEILSTARWVVCTDVGVAIAAAHSLFFFWAYQTSQ